MAADQLTSPETIAPAERVGVVSLMKSGTHLIQEPMVALGYGPYGTSRIRPEIRARGAQRRRRSRDVALPPVCFATARPGTDVAARARGFDDTGLLSVWMPWQPGQDPTVVHRVATELAATLDAGVRPIPASPDLLSDPQ